MGHGATGTLVLDAYPNREEMMVGAEYKTLEGCRASLARSEDAQAKAIAAHEASVADGKVELAESQERFDHNCEGFSKAEVKGIIERFLARRKEAEQDAADIQAIRDRRRK